MGDRADRRLALELGFQARERREAAFARRVVDSSELSVAFEWAGRRKNGLSSPAGAQVALGHAWHRGRDLHQG